MEEPIFITPNWPAPNNVKALQTTRMGGFSQPPYTGFNLGLHVQDDASAVIKNRQLLADYVPNTPVWINQVHGIAVINAAESHGLQDADASFSREKQVVCTVMTADCLPVLLCDTSGTTVAAVHAGWRGLCDGVIEATVEQMKVSSHEILAWLGPAIGPSAFVVNDDVRQQFINKDAQAALGFRASGNQWLCNMYAIATQRLNKKGVMQIYGGEAHSDFCTYSNAEQFFSFRRDNITGRMASMIWLT